MIVKRLMRVFIFIITIFLATPAMVSLAGTLLIDFDNGKMDGWERSPQNQKNNSVFWGLAEKALMFDPKGQPWDQSISQLNFVGNKQVTNVSEWTDYEIELDIKHAEVADWPGGFRGRVDLDTGGHYAVWFYPGSGKINLYKNPGWDINTGLTDLGNSPYKAEAGKYHTAKLSCIGDTIKVFYDGKEIISAKDSEHKKGTIAMDVQDKVVYFDNIKVTGSDIPNVKLSLVQSAGKLTATWGVIKTKHY